MEQNNPTEYYFKKVEEAYHKQFLLIKASAEDSNNSVDLGDMPDKINWADLLSASSNESFPDIELTDEMKEAIAIANREYFDQMIDFVDNGYDKYLKIREINTRVLVTMQSFQAEVNKIESAIFEYTAENNSLLPPLVLTGEELFTALLMLEPQELRSVLPSSLPVKTYSFILKAIESHDKNLFDSLMEELRMSDLKNLRGCLYPKIEELYPYSDYLSTLLDCDSSLYTFLISEIAGEDEMLLDLHEDITSKIHHQGIPEPADWECYVQKILIFFFRLMFCASDTPLILRRKAINLLKDWNKGVEFNEGIDIDKISSLNSLKALEIMVTVRNKWLIDGIRQQIGNIYSNKTVEVTEVGKNEPRRLPFPSRIEFKVKDPTQQNEILSGLFKEFGRFLESQDGSLISHDDFVYLFSGRIARPLTYHPPYYWNQADKYFAGLVRLLYFGQEKGFNDTILLIVDKGKDKSSVKWSSRKQGLGKPILKPIEEKIQNIVFEVTGHRLPDVDLTKLNKPKEEKAKKNEETES